MTKHISKAIGAVAAIFLSIGSALAQDMVKEGDSQGLEKTIRYNVSTFTDTRDRKLEDVMKKMPGLSNDWGGFSYNGMWVEKVYVGGQDILGDDTDIIFNMKPEEVEYIEIYENHVPQKVMKGIQYSDNASINIVLKESAHSGWSGAVKAGGGILPYLYNVDFNAINLGSKVTNSAILKVDDTGLDLGGWSSSSMGNLPQFLNVSPSLAPLSDQRVRFNNSALGSVGSNIILGKDYSINLQLSYDYDRITANSLDETTYYLDQGESVVDVVGEDAVSGRKNLGATVILLSNTEKMFLQNTLDFSSTWRDVDKLITGTFPSDQAIKTTPVSLENDLEFKLPIGKDILTIESGVEVRERPEHLTIERGGNTFSQSIDSKSAQANVNLAYNIRLGKVNSELRAGASTYYRTIRSEMYGAEGMEDSGNDSKLNHFKASAEAVFTYITDDLQLMASVPLVYGKYDLKDLVKDDDLSGPKFFFSPSLSAKYQVSNELSLTLSLSSKQGEINRKQLFPGLMFKDFRSAARGLPSLDGDQEQSASLDYAYRKAEKSLFISGSLSRSWNRPAFTNVMDFTSNYIISGFQRAPEGYRTVNTEFDGDISKGISALKGKVGIGLYANESNATMIRNGVLIPYQFASVSLEPNINGRIFNWCNVIYAIDFGLDVAKMSDEDTSSSSKGFTQNLEMIFTPWEKFNFSFLGEHYYTEFSNDVAKHLVFVDYKAEYTINPRWIIMASITNILDQEAYNYTLVDSDDFTKSFTSYTIRPRNVLLSFYHKF